MSNQSTPSVGRMAPILRVPHELLASIVTFVHKDAPGMKRLVHCSHVCSYFRKVTLNMAVQWATIRHDGDRNRLDLLKLALQRAGDVPLDVTVSISPEFPDFAEDLGPHRMSRYIDSQEALTLLSCIVGSCKRIYRLDMAIGGYWPHEDIERVFSELSLPMLSRLRYSDYSGAYRLRTECPQLRLAQFDEIFPEVTPTSFPFLEEMVLRRVNFRERTFRAALECLPHLHTLELWFVELVDSGSAPPPNVRLPAKLYFRGMTPEDIKTLLTNIGTGAYDVTSYAPLRAWNYFSHIHEVLAFHILSDITSAKIQPTEPSDFSIDGPPIILTLADCAGRRRSMTIPSHLEVFWKTFATRMRIFETVEHWDMRIDDFIAIQKHGFTFENATRVVFRSTATISVIPPIPPISWPSLLEMDVLLDEPMGVCLAASVLEAMTAPVLEKIRIKGINAHQWERFGGDRWSPPPTIHLDFEPNPRTSIWQL